MDKAEELPEFLYKQLDGEIFIGVSYDRENSEWLRGFKDDKNDG